MKKITCLILLLLAFNLGYGQILTFEFNGATGAPVSYNSNYNDANLGGAIIRRGAGLSNVNNNDRFNSQSWALISISNAVSGDDYMEFTISPNSGYEFNITSIDINFQRSATGVSAIALRSSIDGYTSNLDVEKAVVDNTNIQNFTFTFSHTSSTAVTYRFYGYAESTGGSGGFEGGGDDIVVNGSVTALASCGITTTWGGSSWDNGTPNNSLAAVINGAYNTGTNGNIEACTLTVSNNSTLRVSDNTHITIQGNITVDLGSSIEVQPYGSVVQNDDLAIVTNNGSISVTKKTAALNVWYEYTYWSSPVSGETINGGLFESDASRRYLFNAQNYLDSNKEINNNNTPVSGQDDIDDNNNDWQWVSGSTTMVPGIGYASTHDEIVFGFTPGIPPYQFDYVFEGPFNNGVITVPIYRNDIETADNNWNLIGNPYPSAIDADLFLAGNSSLDGAIYFWSQNTAPSSTSNGNQAQNFADSDYAIINGTGETAGGDVIKPNRVIPSGQAFFVTMDNLSAASLVSGTIYTADVTFNNSMRINGFLDNSQFFKNSNKSKKGNSNSNKLWVNLTSDNGVFNQTLIGYVNGATNDNDGMYYDAVKNLSSNTSASFYSIIEGSDKKFAIQGKNPNSLDENETLQLGFKTTIDVATLYKLSLANVQGDFLTNNSIYVKDNLLNKVHDLSVSDYTFTSEVGEFNDRFVLAYSSSALLSTNESLLAEKSLRIVELDSDNVQFRVSNNLKIKTVEIYDLLGRALYNFKTNSPSKTFNLSKLNSSVFIAKVELSNGAIISRKAVKK